jgi:pyruvate-formate lyase
MRADRVDPGVKYLAEPYLSGYGLEDFPRIKDFLEIHFTATSEVCPERPKLVTDWFKTHGFETDSQGNPWIPELRQGHVFKYLMENRAPVIRKNDLIAGTTTTKEIGVVVYPDSHGTMIWSELLTVPHRSLNPYDISPETADLLHSEVFPFWIHRNFKEWVRDKYKSPLCQAIDERFAVYFIWKQAALSHTIPDFPKILEMGATGIIDQIRQELAAGRQNAAQTATRQGMILCLEGLIAYGENLARQAEADAAAEADPKRKAELARLAGICRRVPAYPARTLDEAVNAMWMTWVGLHMENTNAGLSLGRLDQWLQPFFEADMAALETEQACRDYIRHPLMNWKLGPDVGRVENDDFQTFDQFLEAFFDQFRFLLDQSIEYNNMLGMAHQAIRPTPMLSALIGDCIQKGLYVTHGGARYNSSGAACIGLADVTDSLMVIKKLVFDEKRVSFAALKKAVDENFANDPALYALVTKKVPLFGSGSDEAVAMADRVTKFAHDYYGSHINYRGGRYTAGFWSMSNHVIYGTLSCALPSGKLTGKPFTPGLTPEPHASASLLDNIRDVARLNPRHMNNNIAFNVKVVPGGGDKRESIIDRMFSYVKIYFDLGGMQMQMNVVTSETLRDAMAHPENYRNLLVRISGYNAYFVTLNSDLQKELIERAEYGL